jgi:ATP phosphoribosyltransferase regulatory subunit
MPGALEAAIRQAARRRRAEAALAATFAAWGYAEVTVPLLQPAEGGEDWGGAYRVIDQDGSVLALRPDLTGPIARLVAAEDADGPRPRRLFYLAGLFRREAGPRELAQAGAELIGAAGPLADAEALALCLDALAALGLSACRIAVGDMRLVAELCQGAPGAEEALRRRDFVALARSFGGRVPEALLWRGSAAAALDRPWPAAAADLLGTLRLLAEAGLAGAVDVEPALCRPGGYYTGLVFEVTHPAWPRPLGGGGRYDELLGRYGRAEPAVGFAIDLEAAAALAADPGQAGDGVLLAAAPGEEARTLRRARELRQAGTRAVLELLPRGDAERQAYAAAVGCREVVAGGRRTLLAWQRGAEAAGAWA